MSRKTWKNWPIRHPILSAFALSAVAIQFTPKLVSDASEDYLQGNNYPATLAEKFETSNIRVYGRHNPLSSLHAIGHPLRKTWESDYSLTERLSSTALSLRAMLKIAKKEGFNYIPPYSKITVFALPSKKICFIKPPNGTVKLARALSSLGRSEKLKGVKEFNLENDLTEIQDIIKTFIIAHEMRHCEQPIYVAKDNLNETDADLYAFEVIGSAGYSDSALQEAVKLIAAARIVSSIHTDNLLHSTGFGIITGKASPLLSSLGLEYRSVAKIVSHLVEKVDFPKEIKEDDEKRYHSAKALLNSDILSKNGYKNEHFFLTQYTKAYEYLNEVSNGALNVKPDFYQEIETALFDDVSQNYTTRQAFVFE